MDLSHCHVQVSNMNRAREFYEKLFEFSEDYVCNRDKIFLRNKHDFVLGLERVENPETLPSWFHFGFDAKSVEKIRAVFQRVKELGFEIKSEIQDSGDPINFYCADPDGNSIEVYYNQT